MEIVIAVGAVGAALLGGSSTYYMWKKYKHPELTQYDAVLSLDYKDIYQHASNDDGNKNEDAVCWKYAKEENFIEETQDEVIVSLIGDYNQGKTFVLNHLANTFMESKYHTRTEGLCFKRTKIVVEKKDVNVLFIDSEGSNCLPEDPNDLDQLTAKSNYDKFICIMASRLADIPIIVVEQSSQNLMKQIYEVGSILKSKGSANRTIVIVYNCKSVEKKKDLTELFEKEVIEKFKCAKFEAPPPSTISFYTDAANIKGDKFELIHLALGQEGSEAGKHFNKNTFECIKYLIDRGQQIKGHKMFSISQQVYALMPLFKRYLGITVVGHHGGGSI